MNELDDGLPDSDDEEGAQPLAPSNMLPPPSPDEERPPKATKKPAAVKVKKVAGVSSFDAALMQIATDPDIDSPEREKRISRIERLVAATQSRTNALVKEEREQAELAADAKHRREMAKLRLQSELKLSEKSAVSKNTVNVAVGKERAKTDGAKDVLNSKADMKRKEDQLQMDMINSRLGGAGRPQQSHNTPSAFIGRFPAPGSGDAALFQEFSAYKRQKGHADRHRQEGPNEESEESAYNRGRNQRDNDDEDDDEDDENDEEEEDDDEEEEEDAMPDHTASAKVWRAWGTKQKEDKARRDAKKAKGRK